MKKVSILIPALLCISLHLSAQCNPDTEAPVVATINSLSVNIMPTKMITLWDTDFLMYVQDNCSANADIQLSLRKSGAGTGFPVDAIGNPVHSLTFDCSELGTQSIELWARDENGNTAKGSSFVIIQDNANQCNPEPPVIHSCARTEQNDLIAKTVWTLIGPSSPGIPPPINHFTMACLENTGLPLGNGYVIQPTRDDDPLNGVSTFDLVLINKHILGLAPLNSPYKILAADANKSRSITTFDIVTLRKLILGIYTDLPNSNSWGFIRKDYTFPDPSNPFKTTVPEADTIELGLSLSDFVGYKVGDVNGNALPDFGNPPAETRSAVSLLLEDALLRPGETRRIPVRLSQAQSLVGLQMALEFNPQALEISKLIPGDGLDISENFEAFYARPESGLLTLSWDAVSARTIQAKEPVIYLEIKALQACRLSDVLQLLPKRLQPELYLDAGQEAAEIASLRLEFLETPATGQVEVFPVAPNPSNQAAWLPLLLPAPAAVRLEVFELSGKRIYAAEQNYLSGMQRLEIPEYVLSGPTRMLTYRVDINGAAYFGKLTHWEGSR